MKSLHSPPVRRRRIGVAAAAFGMLAALLTAHPAAAVPGPEDPVPPQEYSAVQQEAVEEAVERGEVPAPGETAHSDNITHLANMPKSALKGTNSDLAFQGDYAFAGNYDGFVVYDISRPEQPRIVSQVLCPGAQNDVSVSGDLLFLSVDSSRSDDSCSSVSQPASEKDSWEGVRVFDISDKRNPRYVSAVETPCGSHTHTLVPDRQDVYVYVSSYFPSEAFPDCQPPHDGISVVKVPRQAPEQAELTTFAGLFPDGGYPGEEGRPQNTPTSGCHDITAFPAQGVAAGACMGDGILMDITDPAQPRVIDRVQDRENFAFWHSATFSKDGRKVVFTDELGGGGAATCNARTGGDKGANGIYHVKGKGEKSRLDFRSYYKIPRHQADTENCVAHNGSLIPVRGGRDIMVQSWYQGGVSVWDFTNSHRPREIGYFERGPESTERLSFGGTWSAYYYNGHIYSNDQNGMDVLRIDDRRTDSAESLRLAELNVQTQPRYR
ncbi:LVIVD repeat-containing protein [Streptomyces marinisediminis]|uniref:LVIVD repeat-containing protein n=1 Tax=Streptomyces TaxID=1883 RepID=UPI003A4C6ED0